MKEILDYAGTVMDIRQEKKVLLKMADIILLVFFATLANADDWVEIEMFGKEHEDFLQYFLVFFFCFFFFVFCKIIWNFQMESLPMIHSKEFLQWCPLNFWKVFSKSGMKC